MADERILPKGVMAFKPHQNAPGFVKAALSISINELNTWLKGEGNAFLQEHEKYGKQLKLQILESKEGKYYLTVDTYVKGETKAAASSTDDLPF